MRILIWAPSNDAKAINPLYMDQALKRLKPYKVMVSFAEHFINHHPHIPTLSRKQKIITLKQFAHSTLYNVLMPVYGGYGSLVLLDTLKKISINPHQRILKNIQAIHGIDFSKLCNEQLAEKELKKIIHLLRGHNVTYSRPLYYNDGYWYISKRKSYSHEGWKRINTNQYFFSGTVVGGNLNSLTNLMGTEFFPDITDKIVVIESLADEPITRFIRDLKHLTWHPDFRNIKLLIIGKFGFESPMNDFYVLQKIIKNELQILNIPILCNIDISHTEPSFPFIIGGNMTIDLLQASISIEW
jgi:muramoyltetrapeptide carboxypeptidase